MDLTHGTGPGAPHSDETFFGLHPGASPVGGQCLPDFRFCPSDFFLAPPAVFFWEEEVGVFGRKKRENF